MNVIAFILVLTTWTPSGPHFVMQEFTTEQACHAEESRINESLLHHRDDTTTTRCSPKA